MVQPSKKTVHAQLLELFYQFPQQSFTVREIGRKLKVGHSSVQYNLNQLKEKGYSVAQIKVGSLSFDFKIG